MHTRLHPPHIVLVCLLIAALAGCSGSQGVAPASDPGALATAQAMPPAPIVGRLAPELALTTYGGETIRLADLRGRPVVINFWATWCGPCRLEMPELQKAAAARDELAVIGIQVREDDGDAQAFLQEVGATFPTGQDREGAIQAAYLKREALPTTFFIDRQGLVRYVQLGPMTADFIEARLAELDS